LPNWLLGGLAEAEKCNVLNFPQIDVSTITTKRHGPDGGAVAFVGENGQMADNSIGERDSCIIGELDEKGGILLF